MIRPADITARAWLAAWRAEHEFHDSHDGDAKYRDALQVLLERAAAEQEDLDRLAAGLPAVEPLPPREGRWQGWHAKNRSG